MSLVSNAYLLFILFTVIIYYLSPERVRWLVLLIASYAYYLCAGPRMILFLLFSTFVTWGFAVWIGRVQESGQEGKLAHRLVAIGLICNFGMLGYLKYCNFFIENINSLFHTSIPALQILLPLGVSFYTFQSSGYLLDVYWKKIPAQKDILRYALFVSFFPQLMQGPIGKYDRLASQLYEGHAFDLDNIGMGLHRILRGYVKKIVIADWAAVFTGALSQSPDQFSGAIGIGLLLSYIELYMDFSGAMDITIGIGNLFGVRLDENFRQPYLADSLANFWKRWHITLGEWMTSYVFYPLSLTKVSHRIFKWGKEKFGRNTGRSLQIAFAEIIVFFLVGIWHGAAWLSICYGLYFGVLIAASELLAPCFAAWKKALHISGKEKAYRLFAILRTNFLFCLGCVFDLSRKLGIEKVGHFLKLAFTGFAPAQLLQVEAGAQGVAFAPWALLIIVVGTILVILIGCLQEKGLVSWERLKSMPLPVSAGICLLMLLCVGFFGCTAAPKGFIYAQF